MKLFDRYSKAPSGLFLLEVFRRGELIERVEDHNLIVDNSKQTHARLLGGDVANRSVTQFAVGTSGTAPAGGNTAITNAYTKAVDGVTYPATNKVRFAFSLDTTEANGKAILEFGLLTAASVLYARKVRASALAKESDIAFVGAWTITFP